MLKDLGINWTIVGHSERRAGFGMQGESNEIVGGKAKAALSAGLCVIACVGEQLTHREQGITMTIVSGQLAAIRDAISLEEWNRVVVAYEPVWAIGTGKVATPEQAEETHAHIKDWLADNVSPEIARKTRIIYGGSVSGSNCQQLIACPNIDGFLVGGASLKPDFLNIIKV
jgi:triosephosphate isomerase (TIM)